MISLSWIILIIVCVFYQTKFNIAWQSLLICGYITTLFVYMVITYELQFIIIYIDQLV